MKIDCLVAEIGSTTTLISAFNIHKDIKYLGNAMASTTVDTDVTEGLKEAVQLLKSTLNTQSLEYDEMFASSSAAGGLRMSVSGLVYEMTVKAAKQAASNAGANIHHISAGDLSKDDLEQIKDINPNIVLVSGGTDYGEKNVAYNNLIKIEGLNLDVPIIYAGNVDNHYRIKKYFSNSKQRAYLTIVENVYPRVDYMNINPVRKAIYTKFEEHIIHAKGMHKIKEMVNSNIMPTPGSVMESAILMHEFLGHLLVIDVGGATTDIHSITEPSEEYREHLEGEPFEKRTVEGDLGVYINHRNVVNSIGKTALSRKLDISIDKLETLLKNYKYKPNTQEERVLVFELTRHCVEIALDRHIGDLRNIYTSGGQKVIPDGRDLSQVNHIVLTGGSLINLENTDQIIIDYLKKRPKKMIPKHYEIHVDQDYILSSAGVLSLKYQQAATQLIKQSIHFKG